MNIIEKQLTFRGNTETVYFKPLTGGQQMELVKGQKYTTGVGGAMEIDLGSQLDRNYKLVQMTLCDADGNPVFKKLADMHQREAKYLAALVKLANEVQADDDAGNG